jgi:hypothetical protein
MRLPRLRSFWLLSGMGLLACGKADPMMIGSTGAPSENQDAAASGGSGGTTPAAITVDEPPQLAGPAVFATGSYPMSIVAGDFNRDGKVDLAIANSQGKSMTVLLSKGSQVLATRVDYATGAGPGGIVAGDWNKDGKLDLATANRYDKTVTIFLNHGDGTFARTSELSLGYEPLGDMAAADLEPNGSTDLAVADYDGRAVSVLLSKGDGTFLPKVDLATAPVLPGPVASADFNRDGHPDLVVGNLDAFAGGSVGLGILLGKGGGTFAASRAFGGNDTVSSIAVGDFDGNGNLDLGVGDSNSRFSGATTGVFLGDGKGTFQSEVTYANATDAYAVAATDLDRDGRLDLVLLRGYGLTILFGQSIGVLWSLGAQMDIVVSQDSGQSKPALCVVKNADMSSGSGYYSGLTFEAMAVGDFNGDGKTDVAITEADYSVVFLLMGNGNRTFVLPPWCP